MLIIEPELKMPEIANFIPFIEAKRRQRVSGFADGGAVSNVSSTNSTPQYSNKNDVGTSISHEMVLMKMAGLLEQMKNALNNG